MCFVCFRSHRGEDAAAAGPTAVHGSVLLNPCPALFF